MHFRIAVRLPTKRRVVERRTVNRGDGGSPLICLCLSEQTLKAGGPFCLVSMPGAVKVTCITCCELTNS